MLQYRDLKNALNELGIKRSDPTFVHASASLIPLVKGGAQTLLGAILAGIDNILMPSFTFKTMIIPEVGPEDNLIEYGSGRNENLNASVFTPDLPADFEDQAISELFRHYPDVIRSNHPIFSFLGLGLDAALASQTTAEPYGHIQYLQGKNTKILLADKEPSALFSLHFCEKESGRKQFLRWAMTEEGVKECPFFPSCSDGFLKILFHLGNEVKQAQIQEHTWYALSLDSLIQTALQLLHEDPYALLCNDLHCKKCNAIRKDIRQRRW
jgi:aminoglycoside 3-N-acetyltransferase